MDEAAVAEVEERRKENVASEDDEISVDDQPSVDISHDRNGVFSCQTCGDAFKGEATFMMHLQQHSKQAEGTCGEAQSNDESEVDTDHKTPQHDFHSPENTPEKASSGQRASGMNPQQPHQPYHCEECGKSYEMLGHYLNHQKKHRQASKSVFHELEHLKKKSFQCEICGRSYSRVSALDAHRRCHEVKLVKKCRTSPESLGPEPRVEHIKPTENPTEAESTGVEEAYKPGFVKSFECPCGKSFTSLMGLKTHQRFSRNEACSPEEVFEKEKKDAPFKCRHCDKTFSGSTAMLSHERWHSESVHKYPCEECGKVFMTLTFYERHRRLAHSNLVASKSFLHQVCQLQKKSFECKICGLKFSRASALHSHELHHTEVFKETRLPQTDHKYVMFEPKPEQTEGLMIVSPTDADQQVNATTDEDSSEPGDLIVKVISSSESDDNTEEDENSDLELVCESDQEGNEDENFDIHKKVVSKSHMNLKIVQVDYGEPLPKRGRSHVSSVEERHDCPDCYRWFTNPASLRVHRMWHGVRRRRQLTEGQSVTVEPLDLSCHETVIKHFKEPESMVSSHTTNLVNFVEKTDSWSISKREYNPKKTLLGPKIYHCEQCGKGFWSLGAFSHHKQSPLLCTELRLRKGFGGPFTNGHSRTSFKVACPVCGRKFRHKGIVALHMRRHENGDHKCDICNRSFRLLSGLLRHRAVHNNQSLPPPIKSFQYQVEHLQKNTYSCPDCGKLFSREKALQFHMKSHGYESGYSPPSHRSADTKEELQCSSCLAVFNKKSALRAHKKLCTKRESKSKPQEQDSVSVTKTESQTKNDNPLENDKTEESKYKCKVCERSFSVVGALNFHKRIHTESHKALTKAKAFIKKSKEDSGKGPFSCSDCGRRFVSNSALGSHKRWHRDKPCTESSQDSEEFSPDSKKAESGPFECSTCHKKFFNLYVLQRHQLVNAQCQNADQKTVPAVSVENKLSAQQDTHSCTECDQSFGTSSLLDDHIKDVHGKQDKSDSSVKAQTTDSPSKSQTKSKVPRCPICSMSFRNVRGLRAHKWQVHSDTRNTETKTESNQSAPKQDGPSLESEVSSEQATTNDSPTFQTNSDVSLENNPDTRATLKEGKIEQTNDLEIVLPQHHSELKTKFLFKCDKCGKAFSSQEQLDNHKTKAKRRPFSCALCCSGFWTENQLQQHFIWHDKIRGSLPNELRFRINAATALAASVYTSDRSISALNDPVLIPDDKAASRHECQNCGKGFLTLMALQKHKRECCKTGPYHCSSCPSTFSDIQELIEHHQECAAAVQSGGYYSCLECEATFSQKNDLHQHYTEHATCVYVSDKT